MFHEKAFVALNKCLKNVFGVSAAHVSLFFHPTYPTGMWSVHLATKGDLNPLVSAKRESISNFTSEQKLHYYNEGVHFGAFALPGFVKKMLIGE
jgi:spermidine synthase